MILTMKKLTMKTDITIEVATINGSGSQSANMVLAKTFFRLGYSVGAKNLFPSNIAGLATWFSTRVNTSGFTSRKILADFYVSKNPATALEDLKKVATNGLFFYDAENKISFSEIRSDVKCIALPYRELVQNISTSIKMKKFLTNMIYVGVLAEVLNLDHSVMSKVVADQFSGKPDVLVLNQNAIDEGRKYARENLQSLKLQLPKIGSTKLAERIFIDGNSAAALGAVAGGCTFLSWYPITPSSSLAEGMIEYFDKLRTSNLAGASGTLLPDPSFTAKTYAVVQAEDELSAINMTIGAGWAGSRAMTATSGPGLSLMAEAAGLSYFSEVPAVIWDVQRGGPATGLPTRTMQGDVLAASNLSHGDTNHIVLIPATPEECFLYAQLAFELAEEFQTLVIVLSDLDLGMNFWISKKFQLSNQPLKRGKVLTQISDDFERYRDVDGDGVCYRTLPGTDHPKAAYFTRGTAHNETSGYSEDPDNYARLLSRLKKKLDLASHQLPQPLVQHFSAGDAQKSIGLVAYGTSDSAIQEIVSLLNEKGHTHISYMKIRALPLPVSGSTNDSANDSANHTSSATIENFYASCDQVFIIEQNRDAQMRQLLTVHSPHVANKFHSVLSFDGLPLAPEFVLQKILEIQQNINSSSSKLTRAKI